MKTYFISDIHGNLPALESVLSNIPNYSNLYVLGDVVNYGPWSNECVQILKSRKYTYFIRGNHEDYFLNGFPAFDSNYFKNKSTYDLVSSFFHFCIDKFKYFDVIAKYKSNLIFNDFECLHTIGNKKIFQDTIINHHSNAIIGHSHSQFINKNNDKLIINPGSVGQNRDNISIASYCKYENKNFYFYNLSYDFNYFFNNLKKINYPINCIKYYEKLIK